MTPLNRLEPVCGCLDHRSGTTTTYGPHTFHREESVDSGDQQWRAVCSGGSQTHWQFQSPWVSYHAWLRHVERSEQGRRSDIAVNKDTPVDDRRTRVVKEKTEDDMALKGASTTQDQDWLDLKELALEGAAAVFTVREIEPEVDFGNGPIQPVRARVIVLTGRHAGEVYPEERILPKGVRMKLTEVGDDVVGRLALYGARKAVGLNAESEGDIELAERALAKFNGQATSSNGQTSKNKATKMVGDDEIPF